jgi:hypothetical protein
LAGGDSLLFDPDFLAANGNRRLPKSALDSDDRSMREGLVGKVSGEPLFVSDERSDEAPIERPREESETLSRAAENPEARFAIFVTERCRWASGRDDAELNATFSDPEEGADDVRMGRFAPTALARLLNL